MDDEPTNIEILSILLKLKNLGSNYAACGQEALQVLKERIAKVKQNKLEMFKIIFLDFSMPDMDGPEVAQEFKRML